MPTGKKNKIKDTEPSNADWQGVDKDPNEEKGKAEKVTKKDLQGKKIDADVSLKKDRPARQ